MAYNKFTLKDLEDKFAIKNFNHEFIWAANLPSFQASSRLMEDLSEARREPLATEKAKSEFIILPVLKELRRKNYNRFSYFSGYEFNVDRKNGLIGYCDYIFSAVPEKLTIEAPIIFLVEAKKGDIEYGLGQCGAEMHAALIFNERKGISRKTIYGCVTNAYTWCFLKLEVKSLMIDPDYIPLTFSNPNGVLAVLQWLLDDCLN
ncbi:conserved hypothetical protein [Gammaproteobacteria bacterium]